MNWYYANEGQRTGPVDDFEFEALVETGVIAPETFVWNETLTTWIPYSDVNHSAPQPPQERPAVTFAQKSATCSQCGGMFPQDEMIRYRAAWVCAACKPLFVQKLKEGADLSCDMTYAGFWIRLLAKFIDGILQSILGGLAGGALGFALFSILDPESGVGVLVNMTIQLLGLVIGVLYSTLFLGKYGATPGKMALGLKVVTSSGGSVSYARALGRHFAEWLSALILGIGYIMAAFDEEKRALHDRICDTRVVKKEVTV